MSKAFLNDFSERLMCYNEGYECYVGIYVLLLLSASFQGKAINEDSGCSSPERNHHGRLASCLREIRMGMVA